MKVCIAMALTTLMATVAVAQQHPNVAQGVSPNKLYQFGDLDAVNVFNGNLMVHLPIGNRYPVGPAFGYQLMLASNSKLWEFEQDINTHLTVAIPDLRSNAGLGWSLSLGQMVPPGNPLGSGEKVLYVDPTGGEHGFSVFLHDEPNDQRYDCTQSGRRCNPASNLKRVLYSHDGSYLRLRQLNDGRQAVDFPDGEIHMFDSDGRLVSASDAFGNYYNVQYDVTSDGLVNSWTLTDSHQRVQTVHFKTWNNGVKNYKRVLDYVTLTAFTPANAPSATVTYHFDYGTANESIPRGCGHDSGNNATYGANVDVPLLKSITLADESKFVFTYHMVSTACPTCLMGGNCEQGTIASIQLPTGATRQFEYQQYETRLPSCNGVVWGNTPGIKTRREIAVGQSTGPAWIYDLSTNGFDQYPNCDPQFADELLTAGEELQVAVTSPSGHKAIHYFSVWPTDQKNPSADGFELKNYGLPFTSFASKKSGGRNLSVEEYDNNVLTKSSYVTYEGMETATAGPDIIRVSGSRVAYPAVSGEPARYVDGASSDYDGYGHYRTSVTTSDFPGSPPRNATTRYNPGSQANGRSAGVPSLFIDPESPWLLETYDRTTVAEATSSSASSDYCFDATGFLLARRVYRDGGTVQPGGLVTPAPSTGDVVTTFAKSSTEPGFVHDEHWFGGDAQPLPANHAGCAPPATTPSYGISYTYSAGVLKTAQYDGANWFSVDNEIDPQTGLVRKSRDTNLLETVYSYDGSGRLTKAEPPGRAWAKYEYNRADDFASGAAFTRASLVAKQCNAGDTQCSSALSETRTYFDDFGRVLETKTKMDAGWSTTLTGYDAAGRAVSTSMPEYKTTPSFEQFSPTNVIQTQYDGYDRPLVATSPDGSHVDYSYVGGRLKTRTARIATSAVAESSVATVEQYDAFGRLVNVTEPSGPTNSTSVTGVNVDTAYTYDAGNHIATVRMAAATGPVQQRWFSYDGRGFLRWESQPESGVTSYAYDSRGHVTSKTQSAANSIFDLRYTYDSAERLTRVDARNPYYDPIHPTVQPQFRVLKEFEYGADNAPAECWRTPCPPTAPLDQRLGRLVRATRHNYGVSNVDPDYQVTHRYQYADPAARRTSRKTTITQITPAGLSNPVQELTMSVAYDALDLPTTINYPMCTGCGGPPVDPDRGAMTRTYASGRLKSLSGFVDDITYWPNGMRNVLQHANHIADTQTVTNMPRPALIGFERYDRCVTPTVGTHPASGNISAGGSFPLTVSVSGTGPLTYEWYNANTFTVVGNAPSINVSPTSTTEYYAVITNRCGQVTSERAKVTIGACSAPSTGTIAAITQPDGSWILTPNVEAAQPRTYSWKRLSDNAVVGSSETLTVTTLSATTTFELTVTDSCSSGSGQVTVGIRLPVTNGLQATASSATQVGLTWPAIAGATLYTIERRFGGGAWTAIGTSPTPSYTDNTASAGLTYVYRVTSSNLGSTDNDVATTMSFTPAVANQQITAAPFDSMLLAVNMVRAAAGWPALTWSNILAPSDPLPQPGSMITARQIMSCRARMNEALQALGARIAPYTIPDLGGQLITASSVNEVQQRAQ